MLLLHISDIHFRTPDCLYPDLDPDRPIRTMMLRDARERTQTLGNVDAILVGGDIAYKGDKDEYAAACSWLEELADATGCRLERIFVVPGNHDVDRNVTSSSISVCNSQSAISRANSYTREQELRRQIHDADTGRALLAPLAEYNEFAKQFNCQIYMPDRLYWKQDLPLDGGVSLRIYGLTSTLLSGLDGQNDTRESLYLSPLQTVLDPVDDVVNLVICHHPPDWFMDQDDVEDAIRSRAAIHLFGHKHRQRIFMDYNYIRFGAGAVNPDRNEPGWLPGYNLINLNVDGEGQLRTLKIQAHLLQWQSNPDLFCPKLTQQNEPVHIHRIAIPGNIPSTTMNFNHQTSVESTQNLVFRFWKLTVSQRMAITFNLGLIQADENFLPEPEQYGRALVRAEERGLLEQLAQEINQMEKYYW